MINKIIETVDLKNDNLVIIDQTKLPTIEEVLTLDDEKSIWEAINRLSVRGAPAIGIAAAIGIYVCINKYETNDYDDFYNEFKRIKEYLDSSRPTAVNLSWALNIMEEVVLTNRDKTVKDIKNDLMKKAIELKEEDGNICRKIGEHGLELLGKDFGLLTHCNAGRLATSKYGTATAPMYVGHEQGYNFKVFCDETRPLLQGARLTAYELHTSGIDTTLICDNMASIVMAKGKIDAVLVGCDRVAANGDTANKIGTSSVAILAKHYGIPFYVCCPVSTIDMTCATGGDIEIEERKGEEITEMFYSKRLAPEGVKTFNPAFDVTDNSLITAIITEHGVLKPPFNEAFGKLLK
ncbi:MAG: S-methyl-5-thioribose-1-phosphate isomerase [Lachnospirales bacterium]